MLKTGRFGCTSTMETFYLYGGLGTTIFYNFTTFIKENISKLQSKRIHSYPISPLDYLHARNWTKKWN
jgi:hypothetical protein